MAASIIETQGQNGAPYGATLTFTQTAAINDVIVVGVSTNGTTDDAAATMTGATGTFVKQQYQASNGAAGSMLTAVVTGAGIPVVTLAITGGDTGGGGWIVRGLTNGTANAKGGAGNTTADPLVVALSPTGTTSLFCYWFNENADQFSAFQESASTDAHNTGHFHAIGHVLDVAAGNYNPGADLTIQANNNGVICIYLSNAVLGPTISAQPSNQTSYTDATATFNVSATGTGTLHYQWKNNGSNVGSDQNSYTTAAATFADNGAAVYCAVTDNNGTTNTNTAIWTVIGTANIGWLAA